MRPIHGLYQFSNMFCYSMQSVEVRGVVVTAHDSLTYESPEEFMQFVCCISNSYQIFTIFHLYVNP